MLTDIEFESAQPRSTAERVCENLRESILNKKLIPGERLVEAKIAQAMGVSITPVRQAIQTLSTQGLLTVFPYKGTYVTHVTKEYVEDVQRAREMLETAASELALKNLTDADAETMEALCRKEDQSYQSGDIYWSIRYDTRVHQLLIRRSGSRLFLDMWEILKRRMEVVQAYTKVGNHPDGHYLWRHQAIIDAVRAKDAGALKEALVYHIRTANIGSGVDFPEEKDVKYN